MSSDQSTVQRRRHGLLAPIVLPFTLPTPVYGAMLAIWHLRPNLQQRFPLHNGQAKDFVRFLAWCAIEGRCQYAVLRSIPEWDAALQQALKLPRLKDDRWESGFSVAMFFYGVSRYRYFISPMLNDAKARHRMARAFWRGERHKPRLPQPQSWQIDYLKNKFLSHDALIKALRIKGKDAGKDSAQLSEEFALPDIFSPLDKTIASRHALLPSKLSRFCLPLPLYLFRKLFLISDHIKPKPSQFQLANITSRVPTIRAEITPIAPPFGVNLFGYAQSEIGIGEDVRLVALALQSQGIPFCIVNVKPGDNVSQKDESAEHWIVDAPRYAINIFCTTGIEQIRYACEQGLDWFEGRYNIGFWPWELPDWPASCAYAFSMVDELWGISRFTAHAYRQAPCAVYPMSLPVTIDHVSKKNRKDFGLPDNDYLFVFSFDFNSTLIRKNPAAVIQAFQRAYPPAGGEDVGLVLKASHVDESSVAWRRLNKIIVADSRIHLINQTLRRPDVLALYQCCDCYVSLHRAEGFGRGLAEALLLDLQLITTAFSGNLDFCKNERVGLVNYELKEVGPLEYFHADGQYWAAPDVAHAAELMRNIRARPKPIEPRVFDFSPATVGIRYANRLLKIKTKFNLG